MTPYPYHVQVYVLNNLIFRGFFYKHGDEFEVVVKASDETECGGSGKKWPSIDVADEFARMVVSKVASSSAKVDPLAEHRAKKARLLVTYDWKDSKWAIVCGYPPYRWIDTELRFDTQEAARKVINAV